MMGAGAPLTFPPPMTGRSPRTLGERWLLQDGPVFETAPLQGAGHSADLYAVPDASDTARIAKGER